MSVSSKRILVVDDNFDIRTMIKVILEYHDYPVTVCDKAEKTESLLRTGDFDLLIIDMLLSGINGTDICYTLKQDELLARIPVIMISAHPNALEICMKAGANKFIAKPFEMQALLSGIEELIQARPQ